VAERGKTASARAYSGPSVKDKLTERIRAALAGGMSVRKTAGWSSYIARARQAALHARWITGNALES
jgi:hypothetical protein